MNQFIVIIIHSSLLVVQCLLVPLWYLLGIIVPSIRKRLSFELERQGEETDRADFAFELSSQGELEQVAPLIYDSLDRGKTVQVIYSSPSLNTAIEELESLYKGRFFWLRLPLLTYFPIRTGFTMNIAGWLKSGRLYFCRYDFFPELILLAKSRGALLFSATLKNKSISGLSSFYNRGIYSLFDSIYTASPTDVERFESLGVTDKAKFYDFRQIQILRRIQKTKRSLEPLINILNPYPRENRLMMGSCWPYEMSVFADEKMKDDLQLNRFSLILAPHKLGESFLSDLLTEIREYWEEIDPTIIQRDGSVMQGKHHSVIISLIPGALCEAYTLVDHTFVGGGHGRSVHSLLEPWLSGSEVYCGPKTHRSTEFDLINSKRPDMLHIVEDPSLLYQTFLSCKEKNVTLNTEEMWNSLNQQYTKIVEELNA